MHAETKCSPQIYPPLSALGQKKEPKEERRQGLILVLSDFYIMNFILWTTDMYLKHLYNSVISPWLLSEARREIQC